MTLWSCIILKVNSGLCVVGFHTLIHETNIHSLCLFFVSTLSVRPLIHQSAARQMSQIDLAGQTSLTVNNVIQPSDNKTKCQGGTGPFAPSCESTQIWQMNFGEVVCCFSFILFQRVSNKGFNCWNSSQVVTDEHQHTSNPTRWVFFTF